MPPSEISQDAHVSHQDQLVPLYYLDRSKLWETVKPYNFHYYPKEDFPLSNLLRSARTTRVKSLRPLIHELSLDKQGFQVHRFSTEMKYADFKNEETVESVYLGELEGHLKKTLNAKKVRTLDFQLRLRDPEFPFLGGIPSLKPQPSLMTHVDVTPEATKAIIREIYGDDSEKIMASRYQVITAWRPLKVPVRDWPLAICDASSVDPADFVETDVIYPNMVAENRMLHFNEKQQWYWLPDHAENEVLVFKAVDSNTSKCNPCPHGAFPLSEQDQAPYLRESIDVRLLVMYADMVYPPTKPWCS